MSGGTYDYIQFKLNAVINEMLEDIAKEDCDYPEKVVEIMKVCIGHLSIGSTLLHRLDWYLAGDDGEGTLYRRLNEDLDEMVVNADKVSQAEYVKDNVEHIKSVVGV